MESDTRSSSNKPTRTYGTWPSPITAALVAGSTPKRFDTMIKQSRMFWCESIASEKGRTGIMMYDGEQLQCILPRPLSAKSKVHEYGGAAFTVDHNTVYFVLADDQKIYAGDIDQAEFIPIALTPNTENDTHELRFADLIYDPLNKHIIAVCESHNKNDPHDVKNYLVAVSTEVQPNTTLAEEKTLFSILHEGHDFYSNPRISPDGKQLTWLTWDHPDMPWDNTQLWLADITTAGLTNIRQVAGNGNESIFQPQWSDSGDLYFVSDRNNWWNIYRITEKHIAAGGYQAECIYAIDAEFATPQWVFGMSTYGFLDSETLLTTYTLNGEWQLAKIQLTQNADPQVTHIESSLTSFEYLYCEKGSAILVAASPSQAKTVYRFEHDKLTPISPVEQCIDPEEFSSPKPIEFPTTDDHSARALFYPPKNTRAQNSAELPPLIVICHGGPTGATESCLNYKIQYWTNRGFAVADVNYRGSTGYGREFRQRLFDKWGIYDVDDVCAVVDYLDKQGWADKNRCVIKGSSAGGYTVLAALTFKNTFQAGVSLYGIGDLECLANDTHKFEARYLDKLIGPYPETADKYRARSPIHFVDQINCPMLIFQGLQDKVVPPNQAERIVSAAKDKGLPIAYVTYAEEAHGFRQAETIEHMLDAEHQFYAYLLKLDVNSIKETLDIQNR